MQYYQKQANEYDAKDPLKQYRQRYCLPRDSEGKTKCYLCGHSLGLQPITTAQYIQNELTEWATLGVEGHFSAKNPWLSYHETVTEQLATLVGAKVTETIAMNSLTTNLHLMLVSFYRPTKKRYKILIEAGAFPSDRYAVHSHLKLHQQSLEHAYLEIPKNEQGLISFEKLKSILDEESESIALILLPGVQYSTGQVLPIEAITTLAHAKGITIGWDLAHAVGNIPLNLHQWQCDFAVWCHYKYLNAGPGAIAGCFVHEKHLPLANNTPHFAGWWGHDKTTRFDMPKTFQAIDTVEAWQLSNPPIFQLAALRASLELFTEVGMEPLREKSLRLTQFARELIVSELSHEIKIITPTNPEDHGSQISLEVLNTDNSKLVEALKDHNVICDFRRPNVIRAAFIPFYNSFIDVYNFVSALREVL